MIRPLSILAVLPAVLLLSGYARSAGLPQKDPSVRMAQTTEKPGIAPQPGAMNVQFMPHVYTNPANMKESLPYRVASQTGGDTSKKRPLIVLLHGAGERGTDNQRQLTWGREWLLKAVKEHNAVVVAPQCPPNCRWVEVDWALQAHDMPTDMSLPMRLLFDLLPEIDREYGIDPSRRYIVGLSMGGYGAWDALCRRPDYFAATVPICGGADEKQAKRIAHIPVWVFHGALDDAVPTIRSRNMVAALKKAGGNPVYTECPGVYHASWKNAFADPKLMYWLFDQKREQAQFPKR